MNIIKKIDRNVRERLCFSQTITDENEIPHQDASSTPQQSTNNSRPRSGLSQLRKKLGISKKNSSNPKSGPALASGSNTQEVNTSDQGATVPPQEVNVSDHSTTVPLLIQEEENILSEEDEGNNTEEEDNRNKMERLPGISYYEALYLYTIFGDPNNEEDINDTFENAVNFNRPNKVKSKLNSYRWTNAGLVQPNDPWAAQLLYQ